MFKRDNERMREPMGRLKEQQQNVSTRPNNDNNNNCIDNNNSCDSSSYIAVAAMPSTSSPSYACVCVCLCSWRRQKTFSDIFNPTDRYIYIHIDGNKTKWCQPKKNKQQQLYIYAMNGSTEKHKNYFVT